mgnify:CR=1 FL=1
MMTVLSVSKLNFYLRALLEGDAPLQNLYVSGEISNFKRYPNSGHCYFTLRDEKAQLKCVLFAAQGAHLRFAPENGMRVICRGRVSVYERDGVYQLYVDDMQPQGAGALAVAFEQLKSRLAAAGLFDESHKQPIPKYPRRIGVATSAYGAAVADIKQITARRFPAAELVIAPTVVQGDGAPESIARSIEQLDQMGLDVLIVGRGGGSMEDLWAFNERMVAQAVFDCTVPIISAVGHETDTTIIDYVADLRAPTPSAAAELAVTAANDIDQEILSRQERLYRQMDRVLQRKRQQAEQREMRLKYLSPANRIREKRTYSIQLEERLENRMQTILRDRRHTLALYIERMKAVSPLEKLNSGFSYVEAADGKNIRSVTQVHEGDSLRIRVSDGVIDTKVEQVQQGDRFTV